MTLKQMAAPTQETRVSHPHPLQDLTPSEFLVARDAVAGLHGAETVLRFRCVGLREPPKEELVPFLVAEHDGTLSEETPRPARLAAVQYDVVRGPQEHVYTESLVDVRSGVVVGTQALAAGRQAYYTL